jgi:hypothetical protein
VNETDVDELRRACQAVAENTVWDTKPFDSSLITEHADRLLLLALRLAYHVEDDPRRLARCIHYLAQAMAILQCGPGLTGSRARSMNSSYWPTR